MKILCLLVVLFISAGGNTAVAQNSPDSVIVLPLKANVPANAKKIGAIRLGNHATKMHCDYEAMIISAKQKAVAMGGNVVKITQLTDPVFISKCYSIKADVYYANALPDYGQHKTGNNPAAANTGYATLYIYRLADTTALATGYKVHLDGDSVLCSVKSKSRDSFKIYKEGAVTLWAETEKKETLKLDIKYGAACYIRCGLKSGEIRMTPVLQLVNTATGAAEYGRLAKRKKEVGVKYLQEVH